MNTSISVYSALISCLHWQDELEDIAAAHKAGLVEIVEDEGDLTEEATNILEEAHMKEDMADMGFA